MDNKDFIIRKVEELIVWWINERIKKLKNAMHETMSLNPLMAPVIYEFHNATDFDSLADFLIQAHLMTGHATGFGKLVDEKILPQVFGTTKLDPAFRRKNSPYRESCFDEIDHLVHRNGKKPALLSQKAGKWTIQLTMAVQLNKAFYEILKKHEKKYSEIAVGVFYGNSASLTDKYDILRGINRGANHDVHDLKSKVNVYSGKEFWKWINNGEERTQEWVLEGIIAGIQKAAPREICKKLIKEYTSSFSKQYKDYKQDNGEIDWYKLLKSIND